MIKEIQVPEHRSYIYIYIYIYTYIYLIFRLHLFLVSDEPRLVSDEALLASDSPILISDKLIHGVCAQPSSRGEMPQIRAGWWGGERDGESAVTTIYEYMNIYIYMYKKYIDMIVYDYIYIIIYNMEYIIYNIIYIYIWIKYIMIKRI